MRIAIMHATALAPDPALLTEPERAVLATLHNPRRRDEWIRGRVALHRLLGPDVSVLADATGAPRIWGRCPLSQPTPLSGTKDLALVPVEVALADSFVSLAHDGEWFAVAVADRAVGIDLCLRVHGARVAKILAWLGVCGSPIDPVAAWAALEAVLKLRRLGIEELRGRTLELRANDQPIGRQPAQAHMESIVAVGIGEPVTVQLRGDVEYVIGWAEEASDNPITARFHSDLCGVLADVVQGSERCARANDAAARDWTMVYA